MSGHDGPSSINIIERKRIAKLAEHLSKSTHFAAKEAEHLLHYFYKKRLRDKDKMDRITFRHILHVSFQISDDFLMDRIFRAFDKDNDSHISMEEWIEGLSTFVRGTKEEKINFAFVVYDVNGDGYISKEDMFPMLKASLVKMPTEEDPEEGIKDLLDLVLKKMDHDKDGRLSHVDFTKSVCNDSLLLEVFGPCLPTTEAADKFMEEFQ
ncbi:calaxin-like [Corticium candelabrum]|uniref:calaxin-like n=1 Tax=Corticium candelabrum TaxID=121492 RepID=UPI002E2754AF|nr:calaxin-like [Corticium candelabrum]